MWSVLDTGELWNDNQNRASLITAEHGRSAEELSGSAAATAHRTANMHMYIGVRIRGGRITADVFSAEWMK
jgi:uncharacterized protein (DUF1501 family)